LFENFLPVLATNMVVIMSSAFLCFFVVKERLRYRLPLILSISAASVFPFTLYSMIAYHALNVPWDVSVLPYLALLFVCYWRTARVKPSYLLFVFLIVCQYQFTANSLQMPVFALLTGFPENFYAKDFAGDSFWFTWRDVSIRSAIVLVLLPAVAFLLRKRIWTPVKELEVGDWRFAWVIPLVFSVIHSLFFYAATMDFFGTYTYMALVLLLAACAFSVYIIVVKMQYETGNNAYNAERVRQIEAQLALQTERYEQIMENIEQANRARHDLRHHLSVISAFVDKNDLAALEKYLSGCTDSLPESDDPPVCQNHAVDALVRYYLTRAKKSGADIDVRLSVSQNAGVPDTDLCVVFGNIFENAALAIERQTDGRKYVNAVCISDGDKIVLTVDNSMNIEDKHGEGLGLKSVAAVAERHGGGARFESGAGVYQSSVLINAKRNCSEPHAEIP